LPLLLSGCLDTRIVDEVSIVRVASFDLDKEGKIKLTVNFPTFPEQGQEESLEQGTISASAETTKGTRINIDKHTQKPIVFGQVRALLFSQELAEQGIEKTIDTMYRDPKVGNRIFLGIIEGNDAGPLLEADIGDGQQVGVFIPDLIEHNYETGTLPQTNMHEFLFSLYNDGRDPYLPLLHYSGDKVYIVGTALFLDEKYHSKLNIDDSFILKLLSGKTKQAFKQFDVTYEGQTSYVVIEKLNSYLDRGLDTSTGLPKFTLDITIDGAIEDYDGHMNLDENEIINEMEESIEKQISNRAKELLTQFRDGGLDPVGLGEKYRSTTRNWNSEQWRNELYPNAEFEVTVELKIIQSGAVE
jgi:spore germination protein